MSHGQPTQIGELISPRLLTWAQEDCHDDFINSDTSLAIYRPDGLVPDRENWLSEFISVNLDHVGEDSVYGCKTEGLYYIGFEQRFDCLEFNCVNHCDWGIHFHEVLNEQRETVLDLQSDSILETTLSGWINTLMQSRFPNICFNYDSLILNQEPVIHI